MPEDRKTNINNLSIIWQGQSWSVITSWGEVIYRSTSKRKAFAFAKDNIDYVSDIHPSEDYVDKDFKEFAEQLRKNPKPVNHNEKRKRDLQPTRSINLKKFMNLIQNRNWKRILQLSAILVVTSFVLYVLFFVFRLIRAVGFGDFLLVLSCVGIPLLGVIAFIKYSFQEGAVAGIFAILLVASAFGLCNYFGLLPWWLAGIF